MVIKEVVCCLQIVTKVVVVQYICGHISTMNLEMNCFHRRIVKKNQLRVPYVCVLLYKFFLVKKSWLLFVNLTAAVIYGRDLHCHVLMFCNVEC